MKETTGREGDKDTIEEERMGARKGKQGTGEKKDRSVFCSRTRQDVGGQQVTKEKAGRDGDSDTVKKERKGGR